MTSTDRAVSPVFAYTLTLGVTALLITGLIMAAGGYVDTQRERTIENQLQVIGQQVSADVAAADRLARTGGTQDVIVARSLPGSVVGSTYTVQVRQDGPPPTEYYLVLESTDHDVRVTVGIATVTTVEASSFGGGDIEIVYNADGNLEVRDA